MIFLIVLDGLVSATVLYGLVPTHDLEEGVMRKLVMWNQVSADGYFAGPDGNLDWVVADDAFDQDVQQGIEGSGTGPDADTVLFGRKTYEQFAAFWPHALDPDARDPHDPEQPISPAMRAMALMLNEATKLVFSKTLGQVTWTNAELRRELDPREIETLKAQPGNDIMIFGSGSVVSQLTQHGLIDEYQFIVMPVLLGGGRDLLTDVSTSAPLVLEEATPYPSGKVLLRYARV
jgi:dihydrofolate reductase